MRMVAPRTGAMEVTLAEEQEEFLTLTAAVYGNNAEMGPKTLLTRWRLTDQERLRVAVCTSCDVALNELVLEWMRMPIGERTAKMAAYRAKMLGGGA